MKQLSILILIFILILGVPLPCIAKKNPACIPGSRALIFQVLNTGALAHICPRFNYSYDDTRTACQLKGTLVHLIYNDNYVDNQLIKLNRNQCFGTGGAYRYENKNGDIKTVREIGIIYSKN